jgi:periplasmic divalent cation tolerance protein
MQANYTVVFVTCKDDVQARQIGESLLNKKFIACVNIIKGVTSLFWWEGKIDQAEETLLVLKTEARLVAQIIREVKALHSYSVPEIIALPIIGGSSDYLKWMSKEVKTSPGAATGEKVPNSTKDKT